MEVAKDGIALYEADDRELATPKPKTPEQALDVAKEYFEEYFPSSARFLKAARYLVSENGPREAAFNLHQATERLYACLLLTLTYYTPYNHNIAFLRSLAEGLDRRLYGIWTETNRRHRDTFQQTTEDKKTERHSNKRKSAREGK